MTRSGFTMVDLLVVLSIIGVLILQLLVGVNGARRTLRRPDRGRHDEQVDLARCVPEFSLPLIGLRLTLYTRWGDWFTWSCVAISITSALCMWRFSVLGVPGSDSRSLTA